MKRVLIIDANNISHRAYWSRRGLKSRGRPTSVMAGALAMLGTIARRMPDTPMIWIWDGGGETWRHRLLQERRKRSPQTKAYKSGRRTLNSADYESVEQQMPVLRKFLKDVMGFKNVLIPGIEADDVIGVLTQALKEDVVIYSGDRDFFQLISDRVDVWRPQPKEKRPTLVTNKAVKREFGVRVWQWAKYRALCGDETDKIPNAMRGCGPKTAARLVKDGLDASAVEFNSLPSIVKSNPKVAKFKAVWRDVHENWELCKIITDMHDKRLPTRFKPQLLVESSLVFGVERGRSSYHEFIKFLADYELAEAYERRETLWRIP